MRTGCTRWVRRRAAELRRAIERREWFDPWVFESDAETEEDDASDGNDASDEEDAREAAAADAVLPWVAGCTAALDVSGIARRP